MIQAALVGIGSRLPKSRLVAPRIGYRFAFAVAVAILGTPNVNAQPVQLPAGTDTVTVSASPTADGTVRGGGTFAADRTRTVTATPHKGFSFVDWTVNGGVVSTSASYQFTLTSNISLVANFDIAANPADVLTYHNALDRSGMYVDPDLTTTAAAATALDKSFRASVTGQVYAQPLYWVPPGQTTGMIIVATESNNIYALNANTGAQIWQRSLGTPVPLSDLPCGNIDPYGITGTPVIDPSTGILYLDALVLVNNAPRHRVFGITLTSGAVATGWPKDVASGLRAIGKGFDISPQGQRSALTIVNGKLYVPFAGLFYDCAGPSGYRGWAVGFDLASPGVFGGWATRAKGGGSWGQSGIAYDGTSMYLTTGNTFTNASSPWLDGEAVIRLDPTLAHSNLPANFFAPSNWQTLDNQDQDLGGTSAFPVSVPDGDGAPLGRVLALGKDGNAYLLKSAHLGGIGGQLAVVPVASNAIRTAGAVYMGNGRALVAFSANATVCPSGTSGNLVAVVVGAKSIRGKWCANYDGDAAPIVTTTDGTSNPIVWIVGAGSGTAKLYAFNGLNGAAIFAGGAMAGTHHYQTLMVANHHLYVGADGTVYAFKFPTGQ